MTKGVKRIMLKLSGEVLSGLGERDFDKDAISFIAEEISEAKKATQCELAIVMGGGNIIRGSRLASELDTTPVVADQAGMLGTVINGLILQDYLERIHDLDVRVSSAVEINAFAEPFFRRRAINHLKKGRVVILTAGTGDPRFSTDTAAVLRAIEISADALVKGTKVEGIYDKDPNHKDNGDAEFIDRVTTSEYIDKNLRVMDTTAITLAGDNSMPIQVFDIFKKGNLTKILSGEKLGSIITPNK